MHNTDRTEQGNAEQKQLSTADMLIFSFPSKHETFLIIWLCATVSRGKSYFVVLLFHEKETTTTKLDSTLLDEIIYLIYLWSLDVDVDSMESSYL